MIIAWILRRQRYCERSCRHAFEWHGTEAANPLRQGDVSSLTDPMGRGNETSNFDMVIGKSILGPLTHSDGIPTVSFQECPFFSPDRCWFVASLQNNSTFLKFVVIVCLYPDRFCGCKNHSSKQIHCDRQELINRSRAINPCPKSCAMHSAYIKAGLHPIALSSFGYASQVSMPQDVCDQ